MSKLIYIILCIACCACHIRVAVCLNDPRNNATASDISIKCPQNATASYFHQLTKGEHLNLTRKALKSYAKISILMSFIDGVNQEQALIEDSLLLVNSNITFYKNKFQQQNQDIESNNKRLSRAHSELNVAISLYKVTDTEYKTLNNASDSMKIKNKKLSVKIANGEAIITEQKAEIISLLKSQSKLDDIATSFEKAKDHLASYQDCCRSQSTLSLDDNFQEACYKKNDF